MVADTNKHTAREGKVLTAPGSAAGEARLVVVSLLLKAWRPQHTKVRCEMRQHGGRERRMQVHDRPNQALPDTRHEQQRSASPYRSLHLRLVEEGDGHTDRNASQSDSDAHQLHEQGTEVSAFHQSVHYCLLRDFPPRRNSTRVRQCRKGRIARANHRKLLCRQLCGGLASV